MTNSYGKIAANDDESAITMLLYDIGKETNVRLETIVLNELQIYLNNIKSLSRASKTDFANSLNLSPRSVTRKLQKLATSYQEELTNERLKRCNILIQQTSLSGARLSRFLGFENPSNFYQWFKQHHGVAFTQFIDSARQHSDD